MQHTTTSSSVANQPSVPEAVALNAIPRFCDPGQHYLPRSVEGYDGLGIPDELLTDADVRAERQELALHLGRVERDVRARLAQLEAMQMERASVGSLVAAA